MPAENPKRILVLCCKESISEMLEAALAAEGYECRCSPCCACTVGTKNATRLVRDCEPDLVITNLPGPVCHGCAKLVGSLEASPAMRRVPVIIVTTAEPSVLGSHANVAAVFPEPFDLDSLLKTIQTLLDGQDTGRSITRLGPTGTS